MSIWPGGESTNAKGTIDWAGGLIDWTSSNADIKANGYYYATVGEVKISCYQTQSNPGTNSGKSYVYTNAAGTNNTVSNTDKPTVLKSLLGTGTNMTADYPSVVASVVSKSGSTPTPSAELAQIPGLSGAGPGNDGHSDPDSNASAAAANPASPAATIAGTGSSDSSASAPSTGGTGSTSCSGGFCQGGSTTTKSMAGGRQAGVMAMGAVLSALMGVVMVVL